MMQRLCSKLRHLSIHSNQNRRLLHFSSPQLHAPPLPACTLTRSNLNPLLSPPSPLHNNASVYRQPSCSSLLPHTLVQMRYYLAKEKKWKRMTPVTSKLKKIKALEHHKGHHHDHVHDAAVSSVSIVSGRTLDRDERLCSKLRHLCIQSNQTRRILHFSTPQLHAPPLPACTLTRLNLNPLFSPPSPLHNNASVYRQPSCSSLLPLTLVQMRYYSAKEKKWKRMTPATSKLKKTKMKPYSSYKSRFRTMNDGTIRRWREGKRHNAHLKSKKSKRRLRRPAIVPAAYAKVMKKLNFSG